MAKKRKSGGLINAYFKGFGVLIVGAATVIGGVFAWRIANMLFDKMMDKPNGRLK